MSRPEEPHDKVADILSRIEEALAQDFTEHCMRLSAPSNDLVEQRRQLTASLVEVRRGRMAQVHRCLAAVIGLKIRQAEEEYVRAGQIADMWGDLGARHTARARGSQGYWDGEAVWTRAVVDPIPTPQSTIAPFSVIIRPTEPVPLMGGLPSEGTKNLVAAAEDRMKEVGAQFGANVGRVINSIKKHGVVQGREVIPLEVSYNDEGEAQGITFTNPDALSEAPHQLATLPGVSAKSCPPFIEFMQAMSQPSPNLQ